FASCYASVEPLHLFGRGPRGANYLSLLYTYRGPRCTPRPRLACHAPKMTLRQICRMLKVMKKVRNREAAAAAAT
uniref:Si:ch211-172l8.4 n=1 Tax=Dicentrarchus labrax TaxID=13489 RepID=A0A8P4KIR3_DICLA